MKIGDFEKLKALVIEMVEELETNEYNYDLLREIFLTIVHK